MTLLLALLLAVLFGLPALAMIYAIIHVLTRPVEDRADVIAPLPDRDHPPLEAPDE